MKQFDNKSLMYPIYSVTNRINEVVLKPLDEETYTYLCTDSIKNAIEEDNKYLIEFLNNETASGITPYILNIKKTHLSYSYMKLNTKNHMCSGKGL